MRPAPRAPPQPPVTKPAANTLIADELERRFHFLPFPNTPDIPKTFAPPNNRQYPSSKYNGILMAKFLLIFKINSKFFLISEKIRANRS